MEGFISTSLSVKSSLRSFDNWDHDVGILFSEMPCVIFHFFPHDTKDYAQYYKEKQVKNKKLVEFFYVV